MAFATCENFNRKTVSSSLLKLVGVVLLFDLPFFNDNKPRIADHVRISVPEVAKSIRSEDFAEFMGYTGTCVSKMNCIEDLFCLYYTLSRKTDCDIKADSIRRLRTDKESGISITAECYKYAIAEWLVPMILGVLFLVMLITLCGGAFIYMRMRRKQIFMQNTITMLEQKSLRAIMNPHFVFNVMNSVQFLINRSDSVTANRVLAEFTKLNRKHLEICLNNTVSLDEKVIFLRDYLALEKLRFPDLEFRINIEEEIDLEETIIPSMLIQPFLENAIWHGIMPKEGGGCIDLEFKILNEQLIVTIIDDGVGIENSVAFKNSTHISRGIALINERVKLLNKFNKRHIIISQRQTGTFGTEVQIIIPI